MQNLPESSQTNSQLIGKNEISVYSGELTTKCIIDQVKQVKKAFPSLPTGFYDVLTDRIKELGFSDERLKDAVNNLIDTCVYPVPTIANIISWDKRIKLYNYNQIIDLVDKYGVSVWDNYKSVKISGITVRTYASLIDIQKYNLQIA
jgi:hypothetical protein